MNDSRRMEFDDRPPTIQRSAVAFSWMVFVLGAVLFVVFAWPEIRDGLSSLIRTVQPEELRDATLFAYFVSWIVAMYVDVRIQSRAYYEDPSGGSLAVKGSILGVVIFLLGLGLIWSRTSELKLVSVLNVFFLANILAWLQTVRLVRPVIDLSQKYYEGSSEGRLREGELDVVKDYMTGPWQRSRFICLLMVIFVVDIISFFSSAREGAASVLHNILPNAPAGAIAGLLPDVAILSFVLVAEGWSWKKRITTSIKIRALNRFMISDHPGLAEYMNQFFDQQFKAVNYLMIAHAAAFVTTLTLQKDYIAAFLKKPENAVDATLSNPQGLPMLITLFAWGLVSAVLGYITLGIAREKIMSSILLKSRKSPHETSSYFAWSFCGVSALLLLAGILMVAGHMKGFGALSSHS